MFLNLSTDNVILCDNNDIHHISFHWIEQNLPDTIIKSYKKYCPKKIYVLNWPWSFTNLRVWCLTCNTLLLLQKDTEIMTIDKISLYYKCYLDWILPRFGYIFMGQRKNIWYYDFQENTYVVYSKIELDKHIQSHSQDKSFFVDIFIWEDFAEWFKDHRFMVQVNYIDRVVLSWLWSKKDITEFFASTRKIEPYYAMEPNIG